MRQAVVASSRKRAKDYVAYTIVAGTGYLNMKGATYFAGYGTAVLAAITGSSINSVDYYGKTLAGITESSTAPQGNSAGLAILFHPPANPAPMPTRVEIRQAGAILRVYSSYASITGGKWITMSNQYEGAQMAAPTVVNAAPIMQAGQTYEVRFYYD